MTVSLSVFSLRRSGTHGLPPISLDNNLRLTPVPSVNELLQQFNTLQGRLRISVTHACQLQCKFCHQEGIEHHWRSVHIDKNFLVALSDAYVHLGGRYIELTGGEPTLHPQIGELIDAVSASQCSLILCTNGLRLDRVQEQINNKKLSLIRLSLHATDSSNPSKMLLGNAWDFAKLEKNVEMALSAGARFQLIFTQTQQNSHYLDAVLNLALLWDVELQVVDLITSKAGRPADELGYVGGDEAVPLVREYATLEKEIRDRTGAVLKVYRTPNGKAWEIKDYHYGVLHTEMCSGCPKRSDCGEGVYALRVDASGVIKPCLLREDLEKRIQPREASNLQISLEKVLRLMLSGERRWD